MIFGGFHFFFSWARGPTYLPTPGPVPPCFLYSVIGNVTAIHEIRDKVFYLTMKEQHKDKHVLPEPAEWLKTLATTQDIQSAARHLGVENWPLCRTSPFWEV